MNRYPLHWLLGRAGDRNPPVLLAVVPPHTGERTLLGVENLLQSIAVPEPFALEIAGDADGVTFLARCQEDAVVRQQLGGPLSPGPYPAGPTARGPPAPRHRGAGLADDPPRQWPRLRTPYAPFGTTTCCAGTTSTWPAPAWASPPSCST